MTTVTEPLRNHHKHCDDLFAAAEDAAQSGLWTRCMEDFRSFHEQMEAHFSGEEEILFPAFEKATGMSGGPTQVMRMEHSQMRDLFSQMADAVASRDADAFAGAAETLLILMQQHNMKEENILYPMCDNALSPDDVGEHLLNLMAPA